MTMLSFTYNNEFPVILSDILFTSADGNKTFSLPTHLEGVDRLNNIIIDKNPIDLRQKVYIINDRLCIALGGSLDNMYSFLNYMKAFFKDCIPTLDELDEHLDKFDHGKRDNLFAIIMLATVEDNNLNFDIKTIGHWHKEEHRVFDWIYTGGSGSQDFLSFARQYYGGTGLFNPFGKALSQNLDLLSRFLSFECYSAESILNKWGAGFEITYFMNKFKKLDDYTYVLLKGTYNQNQGLQCFPYAVFKYQYFEDALIIRAANQDKEKLFTVLPINRDFKDYNINTICVPAYQSKSFILGFLIKLPNGKLFHSSFILLVDILNHVKLDVINNHLEINIDGKLVTYIENEIRTNYI